MDKIYIDKNNFPDPVFRKYISDHMDIHNVGYLTKEQLQSDKQPYTNIYIDKNGYEDIKDITGIEHFKSLKSFSCLCCENLKQVILTDMPNLFHVNLQNSAVEELIIQNCNKIHTIDATKSSLKDLGLFNVSAQNLNVSCTQLHEIFLGNVERLDCLRANFIETLERVTLTENMQEIIIENNRNLRTIYGGCRALSDGKPVICRAKYVSIESTSQNMPDINQPFFPTSCFPEVKELNLRGNPQIICLNLDNALNLEHLYIQNTGIRNLDISNCPNVKIHANDKVNIENIAEDIEDIEQSMEEYVEDIKETNPHVNMYNHFL